MKNTVRTDRKPAEIPANPQAKITEAPKPAARKYVLSLKEWDGVDSSRTLMINEIIEIDIINEIDISQEDFKNLKMNAQKLSASSLLKVGLDAMLNAFPFDDMENAVRQSNALSMLLFEVMGYENARGGNFTGKGRRTETLLAGLQDLVWETQNRLSRAFYGPEKP